ARTAPGSNCSDDEPSSAPLTTASLIACAAFTHDRCWRIKPGFERLARMLWMRSGWPVHIASARPVRRIWPPPSPTEPSSSIIWVLPLLCCGMPRSGSAKGSALHTDHLLQRVDHFDQVLLRIHHRVDVLIGHRDLVDHVLVLAAF